MRTQREYPNTDGGSGRIGVVLKRFLAVILVSVPIIGQDPTWSGKTPNFWSLEQRDAGFRQMEKVYKTHKVSAGSSVHHFRTGIPISIGVDIASYMKSQRASGLIIIHKDNIRLEEYALGYGSSGRWESFSIAKSITSTLLGAAVQDGFIRSLNDTVATYLPGLKGSVYDSVSVRQLLTMTSG